MKSPAQRMIAQRRLALVTERTKLHPGNEATKEMPDLEDCIFFGRDMAAPRGDRATLFVWSLGLTMNKDQSNMMGAQGLREGFSLGTMCTYTTGPAMPALTLMAIERAVEATRAIPDPLRDWMAAQGKDPVDGWDLCLPASMKDAAGPFPPHWVRFVRFLREPIFINRRNAGMTI